MDGAIGDGAFQINGVYRPTGQIQNGAEMLVRNDNYWLRNMSNGKWAVSSSSDKDANNLNCWCASAETNAENPTQVRIWVVWDGVNFVAQAGLSAAPRIEKVEMETFLSGPCWSGLGE